MNELDSLLTSQNTFIAKLKEECCILARKLEQMAEKYRLVYFSYHVPFIIRICFLIFYLYFNIDYYSSGPRYYTSSQYNICHLRNMDGFLSRVILIFCFQIMFLAITSNFLNNSNVKIAYSFLPDVHILNRKSGKLLTELQFEFI